MVTMLNSSLVFNENILSVHVYFPGNKISDDAAKYFAAALLDNSRLGDLNLSHNELSDGAGQFLGHAIGKGNGGIQDFPDGRHQPLGLGQILIILAIVLPKTA